jgi:DNA-binding transcriptional LysR family regulator
MVPTVGSALSGAVAQRVVAAFPGITLRIVEAYGSYLVEWLHRGELDLAVVYGPSSVVHMESETLRTDELLVVAAAGSGVAGLGSATVDWLSEQPLVLPSYPHALRALVDAQFAKLGLTPRVVLEADSFGALVAIVAAGVGMTLLPFYAVGDRVGRDVETCRVVPGLRRELILASPSRLDPSPAVRAVVEVIKSEAARLPGSIEAAASRPG